MIQSITSIQSLSQERIDNMHQLQQQSYLVEQQLLGIDPFPPLLETKQGLAASDEACLIRCDVENILGFLQYVVTDNQLVINKLVVRPDYFRQGIGRDLLQSLIKQKRDSSILVETAQKNTPAINLYEKLGFRQTTQFYVEEGIEIVRLERT
ncbi:Acetyltransferase (GNAT) domain-containing protein [Halolactibacillus halophilus]|uniref:Acetyltransferase (GNAT) domain-containing protein n=1 Tax=Halolactibacillus halophilus TaxID=306540 RepID=A0A1I5NWQ6_9BACI|nr:hypothetical protein HHA03_10130 [Halolactibacillus halophilus]SFP26167.1 Acetyltransferase (GNAT) domain-containing protein [Halolactibacillus halophilus]